MLNVKVNACMYIHVYVNAHIYLVYRVEGENDIERWLYGVFFIFSSRLLIKFQSPESNV